jgi:holo-[acyl-carrier protein] synthase
MKLLHGLDVVECDRIAEVLRRHGDHFLARILTPPERELAARFRDPVPFVAGRWAAREAVLKLLGTGWRGEIAWTDMEILPDSLGRPLVRLEGECARRVARLGVTEIALSITHTRRFAAASATAIVASTDTPGS